ncbi:MAG: hypothetical protein B7Y15_12095 [Bacteroidetes bacterium 24-39-8]|nr:MAG: hypothetical protein B7Y69_02810 [Sphingobacteriia bacterium 35-40-8]OYZ48429.1 MAG: hypothetical protein B7Y15_12095 [Bacteroidetes bacterium 24-39-8]OZA67622.1 MAG: hypothetical protein B7X72_03425 [Sphingobacteriia bacterium 39-39-8]
MNRFRLVVHPFFMHHISQPCKQCGRAVKGRTDKQFCNDGCRNQYHNLRNSCQNNYMRQVNHLLQKNRRILAAHFGGSTKKKTIAQQQLADQGFQFRYCTHETKTDNGAARFCYEYGYLPLEGDVLLILHQPSVESTIFAG